MRQPLLALTVFISLTLSSCQQSEPASSFPVSTLDWQSENFEPLSDILEYTGCIELENSPEAAFSSIDLIVCQDDRYFIFDQYGSNKLLIFDDRGRFVRQIGRPGHGPGEYVRLESFSVRNDTVFALDANGQKILVYDIDGQHLRDIRISDLDFPDALAWLSDGFLFYRASYDDEDADDMVALFRTDTRAGAVNPYFGHNEQSSPAHFSQSLTESDSSIVFSRYLNDTVILFDRSGQIVKGIRFDFGPRRVPDSRRGQITVRELTDSHCTFLASAPVPAGSKLCGTVCETDERMVFVYDSLTQRIYIDRTDRTLPALPSNFAAQDSTGLISWLSYDVKDRFLPSLGEERIRELSPRLEEGTVYLLLYRWK